MVVEPVEPVDDESPGDAWGLVSRVAAGLMSVPVVVGFVVLGAVVVAGRELRDVVRGRGAAQEPEPAPRDTEISRRSKAA